ncbi:hypothetical protein PoB_005689800 [Plakobranchus ocellatus]|uniref:Uncharacterized protein n=1 Tax=Plakobranchus ocellatus TaxID=259542 RepID=A0AAV4CFW5_9GAST|nr:hypothetical protein PoB_005689800 [Plakobranchus ocellatus]
MIGQPSSYLSSDHLDRAGLDSGVAGRRGEMRTLPFTASYSLGKRIACHHAIPSPFWSSPNCSDAITRETALWWKKETGHFVTTVVACPVLLREVDLSPKV